MKNYLLAGWLLLSAWSCQYSKSEDHAPVPSKVKAVAPVFPALSDDEKEKYYNKVEVILQQSLLRGSFNGAILVAKNGTIVYEKYVGVTKPRTKDSITAETSFQIASTGKTLTSAAVLKLAQEGKLSLDDPLEKYFPNLPYPGITVKLLLNHRSGLPNYLNYMERGGWNRKQLATNADVLNTLINWHPTRAYAPGKHFNYCNTNYVLLALIVEKVSGMTFPEYMQQNIFGPLQMTNTFVHHINNKDSVLLSYQRNNALWTLDFSDGPYGDKNIYSTPRDLLKWDQALYGENVLSKQMLDSAFTPYSNERPGIHNYGLGWRMLLLPNQKKVIYHNGHWHGFNSAFARLMDEHATIIILTNKYNPGVYTTARRLYNVFDGYDGKQTMDDEENSNESVQDPTSNAETAAPVAKKPALKKAAVKKKTPAKKSTRKKTSTRKRT